MNLLETVTPERAIGLGHMIAALPGWSVLYRDGSGSGFSLPLQAWTGDGRAVVMDPAVCRLVLAASMGELVAVVESADLVPGKVQKVAA